MLISSGVQKISGVDDFFRALVFYQARFIPFRALAKVLGRGTTLGELADVEKFATLQEMEVEEVVESRQT